MKKRIISIAEKGIQKTGVHRKRKFKDSAQNTILQRRILEFIGKSTNIAFLAQLFYYFNAMHE